MTEWRDLKTSDKMETDSTQQLDRIDADLEIMERHEGTVEAAEVVVQEESRRRDREFKDAHLRSVPRPRKHLR